MRHADRQGRPLRALAVLALALVAVEAVRLPGIGRDYAANVAALSGRGAPRVRAARAEAAASTRPAGFNPDAEFASQLSGVPHNTRAAAPVPHRRHSSADWGPLHHAAVTGLGPSLRRDAGLSSGAALQTAAQTAPSDPTVPILLARPPADATAFDLATTAYEQLARGDRRLAVRAFDAALASGPRDPHAADWERARTQLLRRWSGEAWWLLRDGGGSTLAATPVLGGGQAGASLAYTIDPLARRPLALVARAAIAANARRAGIVPRFDGGSTQAAVGLRWQVLPGVSIAGERLIAAGANARDDWTVRIAAGGERRIGRVQLTGYGEAGALGSGDVYAGGQARLGVPFAGNGPVTLTTGMGSWASIQRTATTAGRIDTGPSVSARIAAGRVSFDLSADYRFRVADHAAPASGPAVTLSAAF